jgi:multidrug efflux pump subunit AcrB
MWLIRMAMSRPITLMVAVIAIVLGSILAITRMKVDIFPDMNLPVIYVIQPYGGMAPGQMEGYLVTPYEQHFLYITGVDHLESRSIQSTSVIGIYFQPGTNMADAMAQTMAQVYRSHSYMPPGTVAPFVLRYDAGNVPVGYIVMSSKTRSVADIQDKAFVRVRPIVSTIPGASTPPPFGGNQRSIVFHADPERLQQYHLNPNEIVDAIVTGNTIVPSGIVRTGTLQRMSVLNSVAGDIKDLLYLPVRRGAGPTVFLGDLGRIEDSTDIPTGYALVNGREMVYIAVSKRADASTLSVVNAVKAAMPKIRNIMPEDVRVEFEFDQSKYVTQAITGLLFEGGLGALLTGFVVLLFLRDWRSSLIVVLNIPFALLSSVVALALCGQTINIMTLGGLSLAVGILVDEATVAIENIHAHLARGTPLLTAIYEASLEVVTPRLLAMLSVISVFVPSFFMTGTTQALFIPLSLAVGFAMVASYLLSNTFVPVMAAWLLDPSQYKHHSEQPTGIFARVMQVHTSALETLMKVRLPVVAGYFAVSLATCALLFPVLGRELFPAGNPSVIQMRLKAPSGTRFEETEKISNRVLQMVKDEVGENNVEVSIGYAGTQPPQYAISNVYIWTSGPHEALLMVEMKEGAHVQVAALKERLRARVARELPSVKLSFEAGDIVSQIMNFGAPTPIKINVSGPDFNRDRDYADRIYANLVKLADLRDVTIVQPLNYPTVSVNVSRERAGQLGVTMQDVGNALVSATYSSRFVAPVYWEDHKNGQSYQVQVDVPQHKMVDIADVENVPVMHSLNEHPAYVRDVAEVSYGDVVGEYDRHNMQRMVSITANIAGDDLARAAQHVQEAIDAAGKPPRSVSVAVKGQVPTLSATTISLAGGLCFAVVSILLMLIAYFQSIGLAFVVVSVVPAIVAGVVIMLLLTGTTVNIQSFMGAIMSIGVGVANSILIVVWQETKRRAGESVHDATVHGAASRLRPVVMTSLAMIAGMIPMALGLSEGGDRTAPLGRAVIGGLTCSTFTVLLIVPLIFSMVQAKARTRSPSLLPEDQEPVPAALPVVASGGPLLDSAADSTEEIGS